GIGSHTLLRDRAGLGDLRHPKGSAYCPDHIAANGVVEGAQPEVALRPEITGTVAAIYVRENQEVAEGHVLAELHNETHRQQVAWAEAEVATAHAQLERLRNGELPEKRKALAALTSAKRAVFLHAKSSWQRSQKLAGGQAAVSPEQHETDYYQML